MRGEAPIGIIDIARSEDIVTTSTSAALGAKQATTIIPILSAILTDPIDNGLAASHARPGDSTGIQRNGYVRLRRLPARF